MVDRKKIALVPSYEPDFNLEKVVNNLIKNNFEVVVVDDGSGPNYNNIFKKLDSKAKVISYLDNHGKGYALKTGLKYIKENYNNYVVVTMDSDGQHTVSDALKLCNYSVNHEEELVLGSRKRGGNTPLRSYLGNTITRLVYFLSTGVDIYDTQTGLRAFTDINIDKMIEEEGDRYEYEMNVLLNAKKNNINIKELEIETIYIDNNSKSHFNTIKDSFKIYKQIIKFSCCSFSSFVIDYLLYSIFIITTSNILFSNVTSRIISSIINYNLNKKLVFKDKDNNKSLVQYYLLAISILILNTVVLQGLCLFMNKFIAKIFTELILFIFSFVVQNKIIFKRK